MSAPDRDPKLSRRGLLGIGGAAVGAASISQLLKSDDSNLSIRTESSPARRQTTKALPMRDYSSRMTYDWAEGSYRTVKKSSAEMTTNNSGALAWDESYAMQSYICMYRATLDTRYLDEFVGHGYRVLSARDSERGVDDYLGQRGRVWGAEYPYTAAYIDLNDEAGRPVLQLRSVAKAPEVAVHVRPDEVGETFDLTVRTEPDGASETHKGLSMDIRSTRYVLNALLASAPTPTQLTAVDLRSDFNLPLALASCRGQAMRRYRYVFAVHTAMICTALADFAALATNDVLLASRYRGPARDFLLAVEDALSFHDRDWQRVNATMGIYRTEWGAPIKADGSQLPHNQYLAMARCLALTHAANADPVYLEKSKLMVATFIGDLSVTPAPVWTYHWSRSWSYLGYQPEDRVSSFSPRESPNPMAEDSSHGALDVECIVGCRDAGLEIPAVVLQQLAGTFRQHVITRTKSGAIGSADSLRSGGSTGAHDLSVPRWACLSPWDKRVHTLASAVYARLQPTPTHGQVLLAVARLVQSH